MSSDGGLTGRKNGTVPRTQGGIGKIPVAGRSGMWYNQGNETAEKNDEHPAGSPERTVLPRNEVRIMKEIKTAALDLRPFRGPEGTE